MKEGEGACQNRNWRILELAEKSEMPSCLYIATEKGHHGEEKKVTDQERGKINCSL